MPKTKTDTPNMAEIKFSVPPGLLNLATELSEDDEVPLATFNRECWKLGLAQMVRQNNDRLTNRRMKLGAKLAELVEEIPQEKVEEAIAYLKGLKKNEG